MPETASADPHQALPESAGDIGELFELRALVEPRLLELSAPRLSQEAYQAIDRLLEEFQDGLSAKRWGELNTMLHRLLYQEAGRPRMLPLTMQLLASSDRYIRMQFTLANTSGRRRADEEHASIVERCRNGDILTATLMLREHILNAAELLVDILRKHHSVPEATDR